MAGIGFQLKKIVDTNDSYIHKIKAYTYSLFVIYGPMLICIMCIGILQFCMKILNTEH